MWQVSAMTVINANGVNIIIVAYQIKDVCNVLIGINY